MKLTKFITDKYRKSRGGYSRIFQLSCARCKFPLVRYQKDGPGELKRLYIDRLVNKKIIGKNFSCKKCKKVIGTYFIYKKENRPAYRLYQGAVSKKIIKS